MKRLPPQSPLRLAVLISGGGTTLANLIEHITAGKLDARIDLVISSNPQAKGNEWARRAGIELRILERKHFDSSIAYGEAIFAACRQANVGLVVMAGFLKHATIPADFEWRVVNVHPALIPAFCGRGYYGLHVHRAVLEYGAKVSGCTIHFVDNEYDHGPIIDQRTVPVLPDDTPETLAKRVFAAECQAYPETLAHFAGGRICVEGRRVVVLPAN